MQNGAQCLPVVLGILASLPAHASGHDYEIDAGPWALEQFGDDVSVLRSAPSRSTAGHVGLLVGCAGRTRSVRLTFPEPFGPAPAGHSEGAALISTGTLPHARQGLVARFRVTGGNTLVVTTSDMTGADLVARLVKVLSGKPGAMDVLVAWGSGPVLLTRLDVFRIALQGDVPDRNLTDHFLVACGRRDARQAD